MYEAKNSKELQSLLKQGKTPILVRDKDTIEVVKTLESLKNKGFKVTIKEKILARLGFPFAKHLAISESTIIILSIISAATLISLYALYLKKNIRLKMNPDGSIELETM